MWMFLKLVLKVPFPEICHHPVLIAFSKTEDGRSRHKGTKNIEYYLLHVHIVVLQATPFAERTLWSRCNHRVVATAETCCDQ